METARFYGTGKRKTAVARVWLMPGNGEIIINKEPLEDYFPYQPWQLEIKKPLELIHWDKKYNISYEQIEDFTLVYALDTLKND